MKKIKVQIVMIGEDGQETPREVACMERKDLTPETLGVSLAEGKTILKSIQEAFIEWQMDAYLRGQRMCSQCGKDSAKQKVSLEPFPTCK